MAPPVYVCKRAVYFNTRQTSWPARVPDHRVYDATGSQYQILRNNRSVFSKSASLARLLNFRQFFSEKRKKGRSIYTTLRIKSRKIFIRGKFFSSVSNIYGRHVTFRLEFPGHRYVGWTLQGHRGIACRTRKSGGLSRVPRIITLTGLQNLRVVLAAAKINRFGYVATISVYSYNVARR